MRKSYGIQGSNAIRTTVDYLYKSIHCKAPHKIVVIDQKEAILGRNEKAHSFISAVPPIVILLIRR